MKRVATAVVLIPLVLMAVFRAPLWLFAAIVALIALLATREYLRLVKAHGIEPFGWATYLFTTAVFLSAGMSFAVRALVIRLAQQGRGAPITPASHPRLYLAYQISGWIGAAALSAPFIFFGLGLARKELRTALPGAAASTLCLAYITLPLYALILVESSPQGALLIAYLLIVIWVGDTAAYYAGRTIGRHPMAPEISPNKTWEGAAAGFLGSVIAGTLLLIYIRQIYAGLESVHLPRQVSVMQSMPTLKVPTIWLAAMISGTLNVAAQIGDLVESTMKRGGGVKDAGNLLPGHGGMLDRIDALLFAAPLLWYYASFQVLHF